jgi:hypothetical protein
MRAKRRAKSKHSIAQEPSTWAFIGLKKMKLEELILSVKHKGEWRVSI